MPLFVFLSGLFLNDATACLHQIKRFIPLYILCQSIAYLFGAASDAATPWWIFWYLFSYCTWAGLGILWFRINRTSIRLLILAGSVLLGAAAGYFPQLDRTWSGSRTVVFLPYFLSGLICRPDTPWEKYRLPGIAALLLAVWGIFLWGNEIPVSFLYQAESFGSVKNGFLLRLYCYATGSLISFFFLTNISGKRFPFTKAGADTMPVYLLHAPLVSCLSSLKLPWIVCAAFSALLIGFIQKILQWKLPLYGIISSERRDGSVRISGNIRNPQQGSLPLSSVPDQK